MQERKRYDSLDWFRLLAAALVVTNHTSPLTTISEDADFFLTRALARIAVPFFFMVTGQFVAAGFPDNGTRRALRYVKKTALLYITAILLYLPVGIYAGHYEKIRFTDALRMLVFDGTFYHLWYFPACMLGIMLVYLMSRIFSHGQMLFLAVVLYGIGMFGDSYYGLIEQVPVIVDIYEAGFSVFSYTRNGIFMAPLFLLLGVQAGKSRLNDRRVLWAGFGITFAAMTEEAFVLRHFEIPRHDSMYAMLPFVMFFLYRILLLQGKTDAEGKLPNRRIDHVVTMSAWIYILHPAMIVVIRGAAKALKAELLVNNSIVHYLAVLALSAAASLCVSVFLHCGIWSGIITKYDRQRMKNSRQQRKSGRQQRKNSRQQRKNSRQQRKNSRQQTKSGKRKMKSGRQKKRRDHDPEAEAAIFCRGRAWLELDRGALRQNVDVLRERLPETCKLMPAVKADAYGHGAALIAKELQQAGVNAFCVACVQEGVQLRRKGIGGVILVLGYTHPEQFPLLWKYHLTQTVIDHAYAVRLNDYGKTVHVHVGIDTGMHRLGIRSEQLEQVLEIFAMEHLAVDGLYTHLCTSDAMTVRSRNYTGAQAEAFYRLLEQLRERGYPCPKIHMQASYGVLNYPKLAGDYARVGIALYGVLSTKEDTMLWQNALRPVLSLKARIATVKTLYRGESAGYGIQFTAEQDMKIATLAIGYADGLPRALSSGVGSVLIHGHRAPVIGRICMDQTTVDISAIPDVRAGDEAVLIGHSGDLEISVCDLAKQAGTITNEILSRMGARLERVIV